MTMPPWVVEGLTLNRFAGLEAVLVRIKRAIRRNLHHAAYLDGAFVCCKLATGLNMGIFADRQASSLPCLDNAVPVDMDPLADSHCAASPSFIDDHTVSDESISVQLEAAMEH
jgi:hypothetical protein